MSATNVRQMPYVRLGTSGLKVSRVILGCMSYGNKQWQGWVLENDEALAHIKYAYDAGINSFDTANMYSNGESEEILGRAVKKYNLPRDEIVVLTKLFFAVNPGHGKPDPAEAYATGQSLDSIGYVNKYGLSRKNIFESVKASLKRLDMDYIDVLQCHRFDYDTPIEETMQALHDVVKAGYVRYIGMSSCHAYQFHQMQNYAIANNLTPFISMQNHYNLLYREEEREMFPTLKLFGVGSLPWSPLARGQLTRPVGKTTQRTTADPWATGLYASNQEINDAIITRVEKVATDRGISMAQVSLAWMLSKPGVTAPIVGTTSLKNLDDAVAGVHIKLTSEEIKYLEEPYKPQDILGHY